MQITGIALPDGFTITPAFSPDRLEYQVTAPVEWDRVEVNGDYTTPRTEFGGYRSTAYIFRQQQPGTGRRGLGRHLAGAEDPPLVSLKCCSDSSTRCMATFTMASSST